MQAIIIAAGESSRFWPLNRKHKCQTRVLGKSLIYWTIREFSEKGIKEIIVASAPDSNLEKELSVDAVNLGVIISFIAIEKPLGTGDAIFRAKDLIKGPFFVAWPYKINIGGVIDAVLEKQKPKSQPVLICQPTENPEDFGILRFEEEKVVEIQENPSLNEASSDVKVSGIYFLEPDFFDHYQSLSEHHPEDFVDALNVYLKIREVIFIVWEKPLSSLKYPWELLGLSREMLFSGKLENSISPKAQIGENVVIEGIISIGDNTIIGDNTVIKGPCFIGEGCKIGASNVIRGPVNLEDDIITGAFFEIKNSVIQKGSHFHSGYVGDSVIGKNCRFGAGFITANRRIDRANVKSVVKGKKTDTGLDCLGVMTGDESRFGIHSGTMPGVLIGRNCTVGPGTFVFENLENNTSFFSEFKGIKKKND
ncbi:MAG: sugar phosphate nucleotidyltransferase [Candidatus Nealsonbacteria bacterium]